MVNISTIIFVPLILFIIIYTYYGAYKILTGKCRICGKELENKWEKIKKFGRAPWRKPKFICQSCQKKVSKIVTKEN